MRWWAKFKRVWGGRRFPFLLMILGGLVLAGNFMIGGIIEDSRTHTQAQKATRAYAESARIEISANCGGLTPTVRAYCIDKAKRSEREQQRAEYQLEADKQNANWTHQASEAAVAGLLFSVMTILIVALTFEQQARTNRISLFGARINLRSAQRTLAHAQSVSHQELRPYIFIEKFRADQLTERNFRMTVVFKNYGQTPARNLEAIATTYVTYDLHKLKAHRSKKDRIELGTCPPNATRRILIPMGFTEKQWEAPPYDPAWGVLRVKYSYTDDGERHVFEEAFDYHTDPKGITKDEPEFYLLTRSEIAHSQKMAAKQGEFILPMRRRRLARRSQPQKEGDEEAEHS